MSKGELSRGNCPFPRSGFGDDDSTINNKVDVLHVRLTELDAAHQNLPFPPIEPSL